MSAEKKVKGPASYFPSIERTYGKPISHWLTVLDEMRERGIWRWFPRSNPSTRWVTGTPMRWLLINGPRGQPDHA
jgi:hypothetical protein